MRMTTFAALCGLCVLGPAAARAAVTEDAFLVRNTGDLVALCAAERTDPMYTPAQNFCHGFAVGAYRSMADAQAALRSKTKLFCPPAGSPQRTERVAAFVTWAHGHTEVMALPAIDGLAHFLADQYPCK